MYLLRKVKTWITSYTKLARDVFTNVSILPFMNQLITFTSAFFITAIDLMLVGLLLSK